MVQLVLSVGFTFLTSTLLGRLQVKRRRGGGSAERSLAELHPAGRVLVAVYGIAALVFLLGPLLTMTGRAFSPGGTVGLESFTALFVPREGGRDVGGVLRSTVPAVIGTSLLAAAAAGLPVLRCRDVAESRPGATPLCVLGLAVPASLGLSVVTLCIGVDLLASQIGGGRFPRVPLVVIMQAFIAFPVVYRIARTTVAALPEGYAESARSLGAGPWLASWT